MKTSILYASTPFDSSLPSSRSTPNELKFKTNPKIVLEIKVGKGFISAPFPILLEDISFIGKMRIKLKLMNPFPHVQLVEMSFLEKPM